MDNKSRPLFVYGILQGSADAVDAMVDGYRLKDMGWFPAAIPDDKSVVKGELRYVSQATIDQFDKIEGHPNFYIRTPTNVRMEDGKVVEAEMYVIGASYHNEVSEQTDKLHINIGDDGVKLYSYDA